MNFFTYLTNSNRIEILKYRLKKQSNHTSKHNQKASNPNESNTQPTYKTTSTNNNNYTKTHAESRSKSRSNDYESNTKPNTDEEYDVPVEAISDDFNSGEEEVKTNSTEAKKREEKSLNASAKPTKNTQKSYLAVLNTDDTATTSTDETQTTKTQINYKEVLEKNIPVNTNETETNSK